MSATVAVAKGFQSIGFNYEHGKWHSVGVGKLFQKLFARTASLRLMHEQVYSEKLLDCIKVRESTMKQL